ncbi:polysaccharide deacetylase family protein [Alphaproteobacteria bacterium]|nr:polysaccharide deacetylase family protein [Alphaproteobacteria bacterium]
MIENSGKEDIESKKSIMKILKNIYFALFIFITILFLSNTSPANNIKNSAVIFMYHKFNTPKYPTTNIRSEQFFEHMDEFAKDKYNVLSLDFIVNTIINDGELPPNTIGISIDDADKSFLKFAWPQFKEKGFPVTLFVNTSTISKNNKNYLNWDEIRKLKNDGVTIGGHSHTHNHLPNMSTDEVKKEIEISNKIFLDELGEIPTLFAYPYGEASLKVINLLKNYKYKVAFGQHSGVINETSNLYYLPRFSLNERYGNIDRVRFAANTKGLGVYDFIPIDPNITENPPFIGLSLLDQNLVRSIDCFIFDSKGKVESEIFKFNERIEIRLMRKLSKGRSRLNCTAKDSFGNWRWFGHQFYL